MQFQEAQILVFYTKGLQIMVVHKLKVIHIFDKKLSIMGKG